MDLAVGHACRAFRDMPPCGDRALALDLGPVHRAMLADGLGHGVHAHRIVSAMEEQMLWMCQCSQPPIGPPACLQSLHELLQQQGQDWQAAVALVDVDRCRSSLTLIGVGNIQVHYQEGLQSLSLPLSPGMVGGRLPSRPLISRRGFATGAVLGLFSDGIESRGLREWLRDLVDRGSRQPLQLPAEAEALLHQFGRRNDDASCLLLHRRPVANHPKPGPQAAAGRKPGSTAADPAAVRADVHSCWARDGERPPGSAIRSGEQPC